MVTRKKYEISEPLNTIFNLIFSFEILVSFVINQI